MRNSTRIAATVASAGLVAAAMAAPASAKPSQPTIVDIAVSTGVHTTLVDAVVYTGLDGVLSGKRQFTVFAPTDTAFLALGLTAENIESEFAGAAGKAALTNILLYHVAPGERFSGDVVSSDKIRMMNKSFADVEVSMDPPAVSVGAADLNLDLLNVDASNGVVHVLNEVMLP